MNTGKITEQISQALVTIADGRDVHQVERLMFSLVQEYDAAHQRIIESRRVSASELDAMGSAVAALDVVQAIVAAIETHRIKTLDKIVPYCLMIAQFNIPTNGGSHSLISQHSSKIAALVAEYVLAVPK